jgi:hypothetical protein
MLSLQFLTQQMSRHPAPVGSGKISGMGDLIKMGDLETELQKMYDSEVHVDIGWLWDGGIDVSIGNDAVTGNVRTVAEVLPWLQNAIAKHFPESKYHVERMGGKFEPKWIEPPEKEPKLKIVQKTYEQRRPDLARIRPG